MSVERVHGPCWTAAKVRLVTVGRGVLRLAENKCYVETGKRMLENTTAGADLKEWFEALQKRSKVEFDEWEKSARPLLDGGEGKIGHGGMRCVVSGAGQAKWGKRWQKPGRKVRKVWQRDQRGGDGPGVVHEHVNRRPGREQQQGNHGRGRGTMGTGAGNQAGKPGEAKQHQKPGQPTNRGEGHVNG